jgi:hypothetical protein
MLRTPALVKDLLTFSVLDPTSLSGLLGESRSVFISTISL